VVLKPRDMSEVQLRWQHEVLGALTGHPAFRVAPPLRADDGSLCLSGWTAWPYQPGAAAPTSPAAVMSAGQEFHKAVAPVPRPDFLAGRDDDWATADRVAWSEMPVGSYESCEGIRDLAAHLAPVDAEPQIVHGDLTGNVLLRPGLPPAVIDLSAYWRPPAYACAIVLADVLLWHGAGEEVLEGHEPVPELPQMLLRALLFRLVTEMRRMSGSCPPARRRRAVDLACRLAERR
jgi:uncharacterized protein (TIGR02569 family)